MMGGVLILTRFPIARKLRWAIPLGTPWCATVRLSAQFDAVGRATCYIKSLGGHQEMLFIGCDPAPSVNPRTIEEGNE
jgi:hypothetical protein